MRISNPDGLSSVFFIICSLFIAVALLYGAIIPVFETPDANGHYAYIHELTEGRGMPVQGTDSGQRVTGYVASHPPLYYTISAALTFWNKEDMDRRAWAWRNPYHAMGDPSRTVNKNYLIHTPAERFPWHGTALTVHIARLVSTALGAVAVAATYATALEIFPDRRWLALGAASLAAFNPMFIFTSARVSNDAAVTAFGSLVIWGSVRLAVRGLSRRGLVALGAALGLAVLSKLSGIALAPLPALALLLDALRNEQRSSRFTFHVLRSTFHKDRLTRLLVDALIIFGVAALVCGWWFARNWLLYDEVMGTHAWLSHTATVRPEPIGLLDVIPQLDGLEMSYWAMFGWFNIAAAPWMYRFWWGLVRVAALGLALVLIDQWRTSGQRKMAPPVQMGSLILIAAFLLIFGSVWRFIMIVLGSQGRYLMPVVAPISILLMLGLSRFLPKSREAGLAILVGGVHLALALLCLFQFILPAYAIPAVVEESQLPPEMTRFDLTFEDTPIQLLGGHIETPSAHPGDEVEVSLYWRATELPQENLITFAQILGRDMEPVAGVDCYPGRGNFPPTLWQPDAIYRDRYRLPLTPDLDGKMPTVAALHAGLYRQGGERLPVTFPSGQPAPEPMLLDLMPIRPLEPLSEEVEHPVGAQIGESITLVGYDLNPQSSTLSPQSSTISITLVWRAEANPPADYTVFLHLIDGSGALVAQDDQQPLEGAYRTSFWAPGDIVRDTYQLEIEDETSSSTGAYTLVVGMYDSQTGERVPAYDGTGTRFKNDAIIAGGMRANDE